VAHSAPEAEPAAAQRSARGVPSLGAADAAACAVLGLIGVGMMAANWPVGIGWTEDGPQAGYFPFRVGALLALAGALSTARALARRAQHQQPFAAPARLRAVGAVFAPTALYVLGIQWLGLYAASALFIAGFMRWVGGYRWSAAAALPLAFMAACFWLFELQFLIPLPKGPLEAWLGY
jgi:putative tricarboxylic transport membrane protein